MSKVRNLKRLDRNPTNFIVITQRYAGGARNPAQEQGFFQVGTGAQTVRMDAVDPVWRLWAGAASGGDAPFRVDRDGKLYAQTACLTGSIAASSGSVGGWVVGVSALTGPDTRLDSGGMVIFGASQQSASEGGDNVFVLSSKDTTYRAWAGASAVGEAKWKLRKDGLMEAGSMSASRILSDLLPDQDRQYDLGASDLMWKKGYFDWLTGGSVSFTRILSNLIPDGLYRIGAATSPWSEAHVDSASFYTGFAASGTGSVLNLDVGGDLKVTGSFPGDGFELLGLSTGGSDVAPGAGSRIALEDDGPIQITKSGSIITISSSAGGAGGGGAPDDAYYFVSTADAGLVNEIVRPHLQYPPHAPGYDSPPTTACSMDDEFEGGSNVNWTWIQATPTFDVDTTVPGYLSACGFNANELIGLVQDIPAGDFAVAAKVSMGIDQALEDGSGGLQYIGLALFSGSTDTSDVEFLIFRAQHSSTNAEYTIRKGYNTALDPPSTWSTQQELLDLSAHCGYLKLERAGANYKWYYSFDGIAWTLVYSGASSITAAPTKLGVLFYDSPGSSLRAYVDWFRRVG